MKPFLAAAALAVLAVTGPAQAGDRSRPAACLLVVMGKTFIHDTCLFTPIGRDGSFEIASMNGKYFAQVLINRPGRGSGYWNEVPYATHAHSPLGELRREDACWVNAQVSVCAW